MQPQPAGPLLRSRRPRGCTRRAVIAPAGKGDVPRARGDKSAAAEPVERAVELALAPRASTPGIDPGLSARSGRCWVCQLSSTYAVGHSWAETVELGRSE